MSNGLTIKIKNRGPVCHKCNRKKSGKYYMVYKDGYGWVCRECGYTKEVKEWKGTAI